MTFEIVWLVFFIVFNILFGRINNSFKQVTMFRYSEDDYTITNCIVILLRYIYIYTYVCIFPFSICVSSCQYSFRYIPSMSVT